MKKLSDITWLEMEKKIDNFIKINEDKIVILDWILIPKTKYFRQANLNILVKTDFENRMQRAIDRDNITKEQFIIREKATIDFNEKLFDYVINNDNKDKTKVMVNKIYDKSIISW